jgi:glycosyltransferase involved in cell wall biosynthesis
VFTFEGDVTCYLVGVLQYLPGLRGARHVILQFISRENDATWRAATKDLLARVCLRTVDRVVTSARREAEYYCERFDWPNSKCAFVPLHTDERLLAVPARPVRNVVVAAGRSYRDYGTLIEAVAGTGIHTVLVCGKRGPGIQRIPQEVEIVSELPFAKLTELISEARVVVLPLQDRRISIGQSVLLQAMSLGRPVIATKTVGTEDYLRDGHDGLFVPANDPLALREKILSLWRDTLLAEKMGRNAQTSVRERFLPRHYISETAAVIGCRD